MVKTMQLGYSASFFNHDRMLQGKPCGLPTGFIQSKSTQYRVAYGLNWTKTMDEGAALDIGTKKKLLLLIAIAVP